MSSTKKLTNSKIRELIFETYEEMLDAEHPADIEPEEDIFSGGDNLYLSIDHSKAAGSEEVTPAPETMELVDESQRDSLRSSPPYNRDMIRKIIREVLLEFY